MKQLFIYLFLILCIQGTVNAQQDVNLEKRVEALREAMVNPTKEKLESLVMDQLSYGHSGGNIDNKTEFIEKFLDGRSDFTEIKLLDPTIQIYKKTAIVRHNLVGKSMDKGKAPADVNILVMTTWVMDGKNWRLLARQAVKKVI
jgi:hypothetical protein